MLLWILSSNLQPVRLIVVQSCEGLAKIRKGANIYGAPLAVIVCVDHGKAWMQPFDKKQTTDIDASSDQSHFTNYFNQFIGLAPGIVS